MLVVHKETSAEQIFQIIETNGSLWLVVWLA
jgi:hypothetical protein